MQYVNIFGDPVSITPVKAKKAPPKAREARHDGWIAKGISPEEVLDAKAAAARRGEEFNLQSFLRSALPKRIRKQPFFSASAAWDAARLAQRSGWHAVLVEEKKVE